MRQFRFKRIILGFMVAFVVIGCAAPVAHADVNDFVINSFDADYILGTDDPQGTLTIHEELSVTFSDYNHGILRALPKKYNSMPQHLHVGKVTRDDTKEDYSTYSSNGNLVLKIGDANKTITGLHHYEIDYKVTNVMRFVGDKAELDWNVNGTAWNQPFQSVTARLHVPSSLKGKLSNAKCFTGATGSTRADCFVSVGDTVTTFTTSQPLQGGQTLTFNDTVAAGYFSKPTLTDKLSDYKSQLVFAIGLPLLTVAIVGRRWLKSGRDARGRGTIVPEYGPPDTLKPAEAQVILVNKLTSKGISSTIIDLAIRRYLKIEETEGGGVLGIGKHKQYAFVRLPYPADDPLTEYEQCVLDGLFLGKEDGATVKMASLKGTFYTTVNAVSKAVPKSLTERGYFSRNPSNAGVGYYVAGFVLCGISFGCIALNGGLFIGLLVSGLIVLVFAALAPQRTPKGAQAKDGLEGLKLYLETAEKDRIAMLQSPDAPYANTSTEPVKTVELFEKLLPYAIVLGVEQEWAKQFEDIYTTPPDWYSGNWPTFNAVYLASSVDSSLSAMNTSFAAPSSSSSGFSGGSGGGGGGGGGGGW